MTLPLFYNLPKQHYRLILADPPWTFNTFSEAGQEKSPQAHYECMDESWIARLPVGSLAHPDGCVLLLWGTAPMIRQAHRTLDAWGFDFKSEGAWAKLSKTGTKLAFGTGFWLRSAAEFWLLGTRGKPPVIARNVRNLIVAPVGAHSQKPDDMYDIAETVSRGPYLEMFGRRPRPGWDVWGNEIGLAGRINNLSNAVVRATEAADG